MPTGPTDQLIQIFKPSPAAGIPAGDHVAVMNCVCCTSDTIFQGPLGFDDYFSCGKCGLIYQSKIERIDLHRRVVDHYQNDDPHSEVAHSKTRFFNSALDYLGTSVPEEDRAILDVGCGYGYFLSIAQDRGWRVHGVEISDRLAAAARHTIGNEAIFAGQLQQSRYADNSFNAVTLWDVLFLSASPADDLKACYHMLKPGGVIGIRVRNVGFQRFAYRIYNRFNAVAKRVGLKYPSVFHPYCFSGQSMCMMLTRLGYTNIQVTNSPLTTEDPYGHAKFKIASRMVKPTISLIAAIFYLLTRRKWVIGPSLLVWAEKPGS